MGNPASAQHTPVDRCGAGFYIALPAGVSFNQEVTLRKLLLVFVLGGLALGCGDGPTEPDDEGLVCRVNGGDFDCND